VRNKNGLQLFDRERENSHRHPLSKMPGGGIYRFFER
jgi:hypothetical protein